MHAPSRRQFLACLAAGAALSAAPLTLRRPQIRTLVIGGGPAGAQAALSLAADPAQSVALVERDPTRLGPRSISAFARPGAGIALPELAAAGVGILIDEVTGIDWHARRASLLSARTAAFDRIVFAPGTAAANEGIDGLDARARHLWPAAWGSEQEARRLAAQLSALPEAGHVVLRLPAESAAQPLAALGRAQALSRWLTAARPAARLTVLDASADGTLAARFRTSGQRGTWVPDAQVLGVDAGRGLIETSAGRLRADVVNFVPRQQAGLIATAAGLADASGWCPCDGRGVSALRASALIVGDARKDALRTVETARMSARVIA